MPLLRTEPRFRMDRYPRPEPRAARLVRLRPVPFDDRLFHAWRP